MATTDLSHYDPNKVPNSAGLRLALVVSEWNHEITDALRAGAHATLLKHGVLEKDIMTVWVPGSFELAGGANMLLEQHLLNAVMCLGSVIQGETRHFDFVCQATANGIMQVGLKYNKPVIFGLLTDDNIEQARARSGGKHGNKGIECAVAALKMVQLAR